jgi:cell division protein FtsI/penicillin-binding protein 2
MQSKISRSNILLVVVFGAFLLIVAKLVDIQVTHHDEYLAKANALQVSSRTLRAERGEIFARDADGSIVPLVLNKPVYTVALDPHLYYSGEVLQQAKVDELKTALTKITNGQLAEGAFDDFKESLRYRVLAKQVSREQAEQIRQLAQDKDLPGISLQPGTKRVYIEGDLAAQALGFVNYDGEGQYGIEQYLDSNLRGEDGLLQTVRDVRDTPLAIGINDISIPAKNGDNIVLTIDRNIQSQVELSLKNGLARVGAESGSAVVLDPQNGEVMAMANYPTYNPAEYSKVENAEVFQNKTVSYAYEPGSVMKSMSMGAALDLGAVQPASQYHNTGCTQIDDAEICNASRGVDGRTLDMTGVLAWSLNTGMIWVLEQMGGGDITLTARQNLYDYYTTHYQFGKLTGIEQVGETAGFINQPDTVHGARVVYSNMMFGQGINVTNLQVATAFAAAVNGGIYYKPHLVAGTYNDDTFVAKGVAASTKGVLKPEISTELKEMLHEARKIYGVNPINDQGFYVGGKTGTAQIYDETTGGYSETETVGTYIGYGADSTKTPKYVIMIRVDPTKNKHFNGNEDAMPIFNEISNYMLRYMGVSKP